MYTWNYIHERCIIQIMMLIFDCSKCRANSIKYRVEKEEWVIVEIKTHDKHVFNENS